MAVGVFPLTILPGLHQPLLADGQGFALDDLPFERHADRFAAEGLVHAGDDDLRALAEQGVSFRRDQVVLVQRDVGGAESIVHAAAAGQAERDEVAIGLHLDVQRVLPRLRREASAQSQQQEGQRDETQRERLHAGIIQHVI